MADSGDRDVLGQGAVGSCEPAHSHPDAPFLLSQLASELGLAVTGTVATDTADGRLVRAVAQHWALPFLCGGGEA